MNSIFELVRQLGFRSWNNLEFIAAVFIAIYAYAQQKRPNWHEMLVNILNKYRITLSVPVGSLVENSDSLFKLGKAVETNYTEILASFNPYYSIASLQERKKQSHILILLYHIPLFAKIRNPAFFSTVHTDETGLICWDNATDIEPGWLSAHLEPADTYPDIQAFRDLEKRLESDLEGFHDDSALPELKQPLYGNTFRDIMKKYGMKPEDLDGWEDVAIE